MTNIPPELSQWFEYLRTTLVVSALSSAAVASTIIYFFRSYLSERLRASIQHDYDVRLESFRDVLRRESDLQLEHLRQLNAQQIGAHQAVFSMFSGQSRSRI